MKQKLKGAFGELAGRVKKVIGAARHDRSLEAEGEAEEAIGRVRRKAADTVDKGVDKIGGSVGKAQQKLTEMKNGSVRRQPDR